MSSGFITLSAITFLASPRPVDPQRGTRNIVFDANLYIVDGSETSCLTLLRYFVPDNASNLLERFTNNTFQKAFVIANISSLPSDNIPTNLISRDLEIADYAFQGDIIQLTFIDGEVDEKTPPYVSVTGTVSSFHTNDHSFDMLPSQYIALTHSSSSFPIHGHFLESKRWGEGRKPKLFAGTSLSFGGFIDRIHRERDLNRSLSQVEVEVISFSPTPSAPTSQSPHAKTSAFRTRWDYAAAPSSSHRPSTSSLPASASTSDPSPSTSHSMKKRKFEDSSDDEKTVDGTQAGNTSERKN